jgi:PhnB protein
MTAPAATAQMVLAPYIFFYGRCAEALEFYKNALEGSYESHTIADSPMADQFPPEERHRIMHATFTGPGITFMASDGRGSKAIDPDEGNITLSLETKDAAFGDRVFAALADGGKITMPMDKATWGGRFGMLADRFGIEWMMSTP